MRLQTEEDGGEQEEERASLRPPVELNSGPKLDTQC